jgi:putative ABC transport system permease protein
LPAPPNPPQVSAFGTPAMMILHAALRSLWSHRASTLAAGGFLALALAAFTTVQSIEWRLLRASPPGLDLDRTIAVHAHQDGLLQPVSLHEYEWLRERAQTIEEWGLYVVRSSVAHFGEELEALAIGTCYGGYFRALGVKPVLGRTFTAEDDGRREPWAAVIGHELWQRRFGGRADVLGRTVTIDARERTIVGVLPPGFDLPGQAQLWTSFAFTTDSRPPELRRAHSFHLIGRLAPGVSMAAAENEIEALGRAYAAARDLRSETVALRVVPFRYNPIGDLSGRFVRTLRMMQAAALFLWLVAAVNAAGLALARNLRRQREFALRVAMGATPRQVVTLVAVEHLLLAAAAWVAGLGLAAWMAPWAAAAQPLRFAGLAWFFGDFTPAPAPMLESAVAAVLAGLGIGAVAALPAGRLRDPARTLRDGGHTATAHTTLRLHRGLVALQTGVAVTLTAAAGLMLATYLRLLRLDLGFEPAQVVTWTLQIPRTAFADHSARVDYFDRLRAAARALPGVRHADLASQVPLEEDSFEVTYQIRGRPESATAGRNTLYRLATDTYAQTLGLRLVAGRYFGAEDRAGAPRVVVVSEAFARREFGDADPLGQVVRHGSGMIGPEWMTIVGVVADVREDVAAVRSDAPLWYLPWAQEPFIGAPRLVLKLDPRAPDLGKRVRELVRSTEPSAAAGEPRWLNERVRETTRAERFASAVLVALTLTAWALVAAGQAGVVALGVARRARELGIRLALGAAVSTLQRQVVRRALTFAGSGAAAAAVAVAAGMPWLRPVLLVSDGEAWAIGALAVAALLMVTTLAAWWPTRVLHRADPAEPLHAE